jgi:hypothetical protein
MSESNAFQTAEDYLAAKVQELEGKLKAQRELNRKNIDALSNLRSDLDWERRRFPLTKVEAWDYVQGSFLPGNFGARLENFIEFYKCGNCDERLCMGCVLREWEHECANDCPDCCKDGEPIEVITSV